MAIKRGHRFPVEHGDVFPKGLMLLGPIGPHMEFERPNVQITDRRQTGLLQWVAAVSDPDEDKAKRASFEVIFTAPVQPVPSTPELVAGSGIRMIELEGLTAEARRVGQPSTVRGVSVPGDGDQGRHEFACVGGEVGWVVARRGP